MPKKSPPGEVGIRIAEVTHYMTPHAGGIERVTDALVRGLSARGHELRWIASAQPLAPGRDGDRIRVRAWNVLERRFGMPYPLWSPLAFARLAALIRWCDVVHIHDSLYPGSVAAAALSRALRKPMVITQHVGFVAFAPVIDIAERVAYATIGRAVLGAARAAVACSRHVPSFFAASGARTRFEYVPNAVDTGRYRAATAAAREHARSEWNIDRDARVVLFVGRLVPKKGIRDLLATFDRMATESVRLLVVGDGPLAAEVEQRDYVWHIRNVDPARMTEIYAIADAFALPSRGEGFPLTIQEAMASGLPVIVSTDEAFRENLAGAPAVRFASGVEELAVAMRDALEGRDDRQAIARWAAERWSEERFLDAYEALIQRVFEEAR